MLCRPIPGEDCYELMEDLRFWVNGKEEIVPFGYRAKASIPRICYTILVSPFDPRVIRGGFIHDYLYDTGLCDRKTADLKLKEVLLNDKLDEESAETIYFTVRRVGWHARNRCREKDKCLS